MKNLLITTAIAISLFTSAIASERVGEVIGVTNRTVIDEQVLTFNSDIHLGDVIETNVTGEAQILFQDGTRLVVGPNSRMVIEEFLFRSGSPENKLVLRAMNGAFRFMTGNASKDSYLVQTPSATIGVRGTTFDFAVTDDDTNVLLLHGGINMCGTNLGCVYADVD